MNNHPVVCPKCTAIANPGAYVKVVRHFSTPEPNSASGTIQWPVGTTAYVAKEPAPRTDGVVHLDASHSSGLCCLCIRPDCFEKRNA